MAAVTTPIVSRLIQKSDAPYGNGLRCAGGGCPAVYETSVGTYFVVGRRLTDAEKASLSIDAIEDALEVPAELIRGIVQKLSE